MTRLLFITTIVVAAALAGPSASLAEDNPANPQSCLFFNDQHHGGSVTITVDGYDTSWTFNPEETGTVTISNVAIHSNRADGSFTIHVIPDLPVAWYFNSGTGGYAGCDATWWASVGD